MTKIFSSVIIISAFAMPCFAQVGIGTTTPNASSKVDIVSTTSGLLIPRMTTAQRIIIPSPATGLQVFDTDTKTFWYWNATAWIQISTGLANFWGQSVSDIFNNNTGNVGIGTSTPASKLAIQTQTGQFGFTHTDGAVIIASYIGSFQGALGGWLGTRTNHPLNFFTNNGAQQMTLLPNGNIGIGTINPANKLQISTPPAYYTGYDIAIGNGVQGMVFQQNNNFSNWQSSTNITLLPVNATGYVGINTTVPSNRLQIGSIGTTGFSGNDLAIGNGTNVLAISQSDVSTRFASTTDIILLPRFGSGGNVGINTNTPRAPLEVDDDVSVVNPNGSFYTYLSLGGPMIGNASYNPIPNISIFATARVLASEVDVYSDARIKNIISISNTSKDLTIINGLHITDYTMRDKIKYGNKQFKKVIAQEVEKVYPQLVSKHTDFIPNVYQVTTKIIKVKEGYLLAFGAAHHISDTAKKLRILMSEKESMQQVDVVSIPSDNEVIIRAANIKTDKVFVYGEEVNDFRTVDYEGLTTLNISATQELSKLITLQQEQIDEQNKKIAQLAEMVKTMSDQR